MDLKVLCIGTRGEVGRQRLEERIRAGDLCGRQSLRTSWVSYV